MEENLNLNDHRKILILKALNRERTFAAAAEALGISRSTVRRDVKVYNIQKVGGQYQAIEFKKHLK
jgi:DeoR/GlpR family transcriptional regulator of sugar metabolism